VEIQGTVALRKAVAGAVAIAALRHLEAAVVRLTVAVVAAAEPTADTADSSSQRHWTI
jgi:hypothetical protein